VIRLVCVSVLLAFVAPAPSFSQSPPADAPRVSFSGYIQPQYERTSRTGSTSDRAFIRRMVLSIEAALPDAWTAEIQADLGPVASRSEGRLIVKDAYFRYTGWEERGLLVTIGNQKLPFSRSLLASASRRGLIERPLTGDRSLGSPGRALGIRAEGWHRGRTIYWSSVVASSRQSPDPNEIRIDGITEAEEGWNQGPLVASRLEWHPRGEVPRAHGDFGDGGLRFTIAAGGYAWWNDDDVAAHGPGTGDAARVTGIELSAGLRGSGVSVDVEFEHIDARAIDPFLSAGLYAAGRSHVDKASIEAGYMLVPHRLEALAGFDTAHAGVFAEPVRRGSAGMNWYVTEHRVKVSVMHRDVLNDRGVPGARSHATYVQTQFSF
jgi:hypothetical protein